MNQRMAAMAAACAALLVGGCDLLASKADKPAPDKTGDGAKDTEIRSGRKGATAERGPGASATARPTPAAVEGGVPDIPDARSSPPTVDEWTAAAEVNTQGPGARPNDCHMKIVREWLKIHCNGNVTGTKDMDGFGQESLDYYQQLTPGKAADFVVRLRKGVSMKLKILRDDQDAALFVSWPPSEPKPLHVALGIGKR
jgi:hypothetical protein